jgi:transcriptional regulator with XRE-family HTH domain
MTEKFKQMWQKLRNSKRYREQFVSSQVKRGVPFQIRALMKKRGLSQEQLAKQSQLTQGVISRASDPNNGNLTLNTIIRIAAGFDVAFVGMFVPFSNLVKWYSDLSESSGEIRTFGEEDTATPCKEVEEGPETHPKDLSKGHFWRPQGSVLPPSPRGALDQAGIEQQEQVQ